MDIHPLVTQLRFARSEFLRCLDAVSAEDGVQRLEPMNCISWIVGHLAVQENAYWVGWGQGEDVASELHELVGWGRPPSTPPLDEMWQAWRDVNTAADRFLDTVTDDMVATHFERDGKTSPETVGTMLLRNTYHYWFHLGEAHGIRQMLGHPDLPQFVGNMAEVVPSSR